MAEIELYGADWCGDCRRSRALLNTLGVEYDMFDVDESKEYAEQAQGISGKTSIPVIRFKDGKHLVEPSDAVLHAELKLRGLVD
jgi:glutaredoxin